MHRVVETWRLARRIVARAWAVLGPSSASLDLPVAVGEGRRSLARRSRGRS